jgi:hypothetical protein
VKISEAPPSHSLLRLSGAQSFHHLTPTVHELKKGSREYAAAAKIFTDTWQAAINQVILMSQK